MEFTDLIFINNVMNDGVMRIPKMRLVYFYQSLINFMDIRIFTKLHEIRIHMLINNLINKLIFNQSIKNDMIT